MTNKIPQRNVNLANKLMNIAQQTLNAAQILTMPTHLQIDTKPLEDTLLDGIAALREFRRKVSPIEVVGNRG